jgi:hypothetical protein
MRKTTVIENRPIARNAAAKRRTKNRAAVALGRLGGKKGGIARAKTLSAAERSAIAKKAAKARWKKAARKKL